MQEKSNLNKYLGRNCSRKISSAKNTFSSFSEANYEILTWVTLSMYPNVQKHNNNKFIYWSI